MLLAWALALGSVLGCVLAVHYFSEHMHMVSAASHLGILCPGVGGTGLGYWGGRQGQPHCSCAPGWAFAALPKDTTPGCQ